MAAKNPLDALHTRLKGYGVCLRALWLPNANVSSHLNSSKYSDLIIRCEAQEFKVHKIIICGQSEYFSSICDGVWKVRLPAGYLDSNGVVYNIYL